MASCSGIDRELVKVLMINIHLCRARRGPKGPCQIRITGSCYKAIWVVALSSGDLGGGAKEVFFI